MPDGFTARVWASQNRHPGDRLRLFDALREHLGPVGRVLYPGSFVDIAPSFVFDDVIYVDVDGQAERFFADTDGVDELIRAHRAEPSRWRFIPGDYRADLGLDEASVDLLLSLYAGFVSDHCTRYLRPGGHLLVNPSHGDTALAAVDPGYELAGVVTSRSGAYRVRTGGLDRYLIPKSAADLTPDAIRARGRGIAYTTSPFAYLFRRAS